MSIAKILSLFSGIALFLFGMTLMGDSLKKIAGNSLELILYKLSGSPIKGILLGAGVTAVIQSSSATSVMAVGFVNSGMMKTKQAIGIIMGAIIGTSITGWIISLSSLDASASGILELLSTDSLTAVIAIVGIILRMFCKHSKQKTTGEILLGFAVLMFGMKTMSSSVETLRNSEQFINLLTNFSNPLIGVLVGAAFTAVIQSASAAVGILQALASTGVITFSIALPILMGIAIGASVPVILSSIGANADGKRSAWSYLVIDILGGIVVSAIYYGLNSVIHFEFADMVLTTFSIAFVNTVFRVLMIVILSPFINGIEKITKFIIKDEEREEKWDVDKLEERFIAYPTLAIEQCRLVIEQMGEVTRKNLFRACDLLTNYDEKKYTKVLNKEDVIDRYADRLSAYLVKVTKKELTSQQNEDCSKYLQALVDFERIGDHALNIAEAANKENEEKISFSEEGKKELLIVLSALKDVVNTTFDAFNNNDINAAYKVEPYEQVIDDLCDTIKEHHVDRIRQGVCTLEHGIIFNDLLIDFERVSDHCENIAVEMIENESTSHDAHVIKTEYRDTNKEEFDRLYNEFSSKYPL